MSSRRYDLEERLLQFAACIIRLCDRFTASPAGIHIANQLLRAGTSPLFNHGEAESAESPRDFVHKLKVCLKELRESRRALLLVRRVPLIEDDGQLEPVLQESDERIRIFVASSRTASANHLRSRGKNSKAEENRQWDSVFDVQCSMF